MRRRISFHALAEDELHEAASYYNTARPGLGLAFVSAVERAIQEILEYPEAASLVNRTVRRKLIRRFPYSVLYSVCPEGIRILAIANQKQRPFYWRGRK